MKHWGYLQAGILGCALLVAVEAWEQDAAKLAPQMYHVIFENNRYRVTDYHLEPGGKEPMHSHPNGLLVYLFTEAKVRSTLSDGRTSDSTGKLETFCGAIQ